MKFSYSNKYVDTEKPRDLITYIFKSLWHYPHQKLLKYLNFHCLRFFLNTFPPKKVTIYPHNLFLKALCPPKAGWIPEERACMGLCQYVLLLQDWEWQRKIKFKKGFIPFEYRLNSQDKKYNYSEMPSYFLLRLKPSWPCRWPEREAKPATVWHPTVSICWGLASQGP